MLLINRLIGWISCIRARSRRIILWCLIGGGYILDNKEEWSEKSGGRSLEVEKSCTEERREERGARRRRVVMTTVMKA